MIVTETDPLVKCSSNPCASFEPAGLTFYRMLVQSASGRIIRFTDVIRSTDGKPHTYTFAYDEYQNDNNPGFRFPQDSGYQTHSSGDTETLSSAPIQTVGVFGDPTSPPSIDNPVGTITFSPAPTAVRFRSSEGFEAVFTGTIPAGGSKTIRQYFTIAPTQAQADRLAYENEDAMAAPVVRITHPARNGTTVHTSHITLTGTATDNKAVTALHVDGHPVPLHHGAFGITIALGQGMNKIAVVARDAAGNRTVVFRTVRFIPPPRKKH